MISGGFSNSPKHSWVSKLKTFSSPSGHFLINVRKSPDKTPATKHPLRPPTGSRLRQSHSRALPPRDTTSTLSPSGEKCNPPVGAHVSTNTFCVSKSHTLTSAFVHSVTAVRPSGEMATWQTAALCLSIFY